MICFTRPLLINKKVYKSIILHEKKTNKHFVICVYDVHLYNVVITCRSPQINKHKLYINKINMKILININILLIFL